MKVPPLIHCQHHVNHKIIKSLTQWTAHSPLVCWVNVTDVVSGTIHSAWTTATEYLLTTVVCHRLTIAALLLW